MNKNYNKNTERSEKEEVNYMFTTYKLQFTKAFTLAEVLITLSIIGIVAALVMPGILADVNRKAWSEAQFVVKRKMQEATSQMKTAERLHGYDTTEEFVNELGKYMKFVQICDNTKLKNCYSPQVVVTAKDKVEVETLKTSKDLGQNEYNTNTSGLVTADGTTIILSYNPNCPFIEPADNTADTLSCISMLYDINGKKKPNKIGDDISAINAAISTCDLKLGSLCVAAYDLSYSAIDTCAEGSGDPNFTREKALKEWGYTNTCKANYWYGAKKGCEDLGMRLPSKEELKEISIAMGNGSNRYNFGNTWYRSSSEYSNSVYAYDVYMGTGGGHYNWESKENKTPVRCVW